MGTPRQSDGDIKKGYATDRKSIWNGSVPFIQKHARELQKLNLHSLTISKTNPFQQGQNGKLKDGRDPSGPLCKERGVTSKLFVENP
jgi:hypothetical protein